MITYHKPQFSAFNKKQIDMLMKDYLVNHFLPNIPLSEQEKLLEKSNYKKLKSKEEIINLTKNDPFFAKMGFKFTQGFLAYLKHKKIK